MRDFIELCILGLGSVLGMWAALRLAYRCRRPWLAAVVGLVAGWALPSAATLLLGLVRGILIGRDPLFLAWLQAVLASPIISIACALLAWRQARRLEAQSSVATAEPPPDDPTARLAKMERELAQLARHFRLALFATSLAIVGVLAVVAWAVDQQRQRSPLGERIDARSIVLRDGNFEVRGILDVEGGTARFRLFDGKGQQRAGMAVTEAGVPAIGVMDASGNTHGVLGFADDQPALYLRDEQQKAGVGLLMTKERGQLIAGVNLFDSSGHMRAALSWTDEGPILFFTDDDERSRVEHEQEAGAVVAHQR
jgi:hypothetical protein